MPEGVFYRSGDTRFLVFPSGGTASGTHTQLNWTVDDIETEVAALKARPRMSDTVIARKTHLDLDGCVTLGEGP